MTAEHTSSCYLDSQDDWMCTYWCPVGGVLHHLDNMIKLSRTFAINRRESHVRSQAASALHHWRHNR